MFIVGAAICRPLFFTLQNAIKKAAPRKEVPQGV